MKKILVDARPLHDPHPGGVTRFADGLIRALPAVAPEMEFILGTTGARLRGNDRHLYIPNKLWSLGCLAHTCSFDQLAPNTDALLLPNIGFVGAIKKPYALIVHDVAYWIEPAWFTPRARLWHHATQARRTIERASRLLCVSNRTAEDVQDIFKIPSSKISVFKPGLHPEDLSHTTSLLPYSLLSSSRFILSFGARDPRKNISCIELAVRVLKQKPEYHDVELVTIGGTHPFQSREQLQALYAQASCIAYPSWYEGFGIPLHEASVYGTPCIASTAGALPETAPPGTLFAPPQKPHLWTEALEIVLSNPTAYKTTRTLGDWTEGATHIAQTLASL